MVGNTTSNDVPPPSNTFLQQGELVENGIEAENKVKKIRNLSDPNFFQSDSFRSINKPLDFTEFNKKIISFIFLILLFLLLLIYLLVYKLIQPLIIIQMLIILLTLIIIITFIMAIVWIFLMII
jgi:hypothetical protein